MLLFRIKFEKTGIAKYISHLDLSRMFSRAITRAEIQVEHSEGFNPHPKIVFPSAISLGTESFCEFADIKTIGDDSMTEIFDRLKNVFPPGINIKEVYPPQSDFKCIDKTRFNIFVKFVKLDDVDIIDNINKSFEGDVFVEKKPGVTINLKDYIEDIAIVYVSEGSIKIDAVLKTNQQMYLNPENIVKVISSKYADTIEDYSIQKIEMYDKNFSIFR